MDDMDREIGRALAARRPEPSPDLDARLWAAAERRPRTWLIPVIAASAVVAAMIVAVIALRSRSADEPAREVATDDVRPVVPIVPAPAPAPEPKPAPVGVPPVSPAPPSVADKVVSEKLAAYDVIIAGDTVPGLELTSHQLAEIALLRTPQSTRTHVEWDAAYDELARELAQHDIDASRALAALDRMSAFEANARRRMLATRIAVRALLTDPQRAIVEKGTSSVTATPPTPAPPTTTRTAPAPAKKAQLQIQTEPSGADIYFDGVLLGKSPLSLTIALGKHALRAELPGYLAQDAEVEAKADQLYQLHVTLPPAASSRGKLVITGEAGAKVYVDGALTSTTPAVLELAAGTHRLTFAKDGAKETRTVAIRAGETTRITFQFP